MRIKEEFKKSGYFWLPSTPERRIPGMLTISDGGNIELEVFGIFDETIEVFHSKDELKRIIGLIEEDQYVTLDNCFYIKKSLAAGISKSTLHVNRVFSDAIYEDNEKTCFNTFYFSIEGIDEWVGISGVNVENQHEVNPTTITYLKPETISFSLTNGMKLLIAFSCNLPISSSITEVKITQKAYFKLLSVEEREFNDFISIASKITTLLCFATDTIVCLDDITATSNSRNQEMSNGKSIPVPIKIYYPSLPYSRDEPKIHWSRMLFGYKSIQNNAERMINNWIDSYNLIEPTLNLYFSTQMEAQKYLDGKFLALAQGLETYHRRTSSEKVMDDTDFNELVENIIDNCPNKYQEWLEGRLKHGNEIALRKRIQYIIEPFKDIVGNCKQRSKVTNNIVDTRNYLTHFNESLKARAVSGEDLHFLNLKMEALLQLHFLKVLGFTEEQIKSIFDGCYRLQRKFK